MLASWALGLARATRSPIRIVASRSVPRVLAYQPIRRWNHQGGSGKPPGDFPPFPRPPADSTPESNPESTQQPIEPDSIEPEAPKRPLPDLRQGLPSTFEQEFLKDSKAKSASEPEPDADADADAGQGKSGGRGEAPKSAYESSIDKRRNRFAQIFYVSLLTALVSGSIWAGRDWDDEEEAKRHAEEAPLGWGVGLWYNRIRARVKDQLGYYTEPTFPKLLPDKVGPFMEQFPPYTLVLSLEDLLVHEDWNRDDGWRIAKRPGLDFFLMYLARHYELCIFTSIPAMMAEPITKKLDPYHFAPWVLFREATRYDNGDYIKVCLFFFHRLKS
jgi:import inner membrane translocase subunit TIM50